MHQILWTFRIFIGCLALVMLAVPGRAQPVDTNAPVKLVLLGTKGGPSLRAKSPAVFSNLLLVDGVPFVIDAGYGATRRYLEAGALLNKLRFVFITHHHSDHELEYGPLLYTAWANGLSTRVDAFGPIGLEDMTRSFWQANQLDIDTRIEDEGRVDVRKLVFAHDFDFGKEGVVYRDERVKVSALRVEHPLVRNAYAYKFEMHGKTIVFSGDTTYFPPLAEFAKGADVLVHEVMYGPGIEALAQRIASGATLLKHLKESHTLAEDVGRIAQAAGVKTLVLSHFVPGDDPSITREMWENAVRTTFHGSIVVGADLLEIPL